ncbi:MarC family protein [Pyrococcus kukulkanii]|uniref:MarC family protein n=1 Tax=Pyrococcus kukulkanii TaxID=1609559 RepID=UPI00356AFC92
MFEEIFSSTLLMLIMIDPSDKILLVSLLREDFHIEDVKSLIIRANLIGWVLLLIFAVAGKVILQDIFHIEIDALRVAGGFVLFKIGLEALEGGGMVTIKREKNILALAAVPVATPLIAGPAAITAAITLTAEYGIHISIIATTIAIAITAVLMMIALYAMRNVNKTVLSVTIRIIGLFIMAIGAQMMITGAGSILVRILKGA